MARIRRLDTTTAVIDALGGNTPFAQLIEREQQHVSNYRATKRFPPDTFLIITTELAKLGYCAPAALWKIREPKKARVAA